MDWLNTAVTNVVTIFGTVMGLIEDTPVLGLIFAGGCIVPLGFGILSRARHSVS